MRGGSRVSTLRSAHAESPSTNAPTVWSFDPCPKRYATRCARTTWLPTDPSSTSRAGILESLLDALEQPALLLKGKGKVEFENLRARELFAGAGGRELFAALRRSVASKQPLPGFTLSSLRGFPHYTLALYSAGERPIALAVARARASWALSARQTTFLEQLARGLSNKEIAAHVGCAEVTVEKQLTQLFRTAKARSRTELMAKLYDL